MVLASPAPMTVEVPKRLLDSRTGTFGNVNENASVFVRNHVINLE